MGKETGRYSHRDVVGHYFIPKKPANGLPPVTTYDIQYGTIPPSEATLRHNPYAKPVTTKFVLFNYELNGVQLQASLSWYRFLTVYMRKDWWEYWVSIGKKPQGV